MSAEIGAHRRFVGDLPRIAAFARAIAAAVRPGDVVVDLASGTGILGLLACRAGAARVYSIEERSVIGLARELARANGFEDRIRFVHTHSSWAQLPERADVVVTDQIGQFGFEAGLIQTMADARLRWLKPGGTVVPRRVTLFAGLVEAPTLRADLDFWSDRPLGFDFSPARAIALNSGRRARLEPRHQLGTGVAGCRLDLGGSADAAFAFTVTLRTERDGVLHGIGGWFVAELAEGVTMTNAPGAEDRIDRRNAVFPIERPIPLRAGDEVTVTFRVRPADLLVRWTVVTPAGRFDHSTLRGMFIERDAIRKTNPAYEPRLTPHGVARRTVLELCDGRRLADVERAVYERHRELFSSESDAQAFVAEVVARYCV
ncbi:MAG: 50S ribosomal protein L11 methyltransferase [Vicinamibacterales bacterium]